MIVFRSNLMEVALNVVRYKDKYLLGKRESDGYYEFVGGKKEAYETIEEAALRELWEETKLRGKVVKLGESFKSSKDDKWDLKPVLIEAHSKDVKLSNEHSEHEWISLEDFGDYETLGQYPALEKLGLINGNVAVSIVEKNSKYLVLQRSENTSSSGKWNFPGGKLKSEESFKDCALRELKEETCLTGSVNKEGSFFIDSGELGYWRIKPFLIDAENFEEFELNNEHSNYEWLEIEQIKELETLGTLKSLRKLDLIH